MVTLTELSMPEVRIREQRHVRVGLEHVGQIGLLDFPGDIDMIRVRGRRGRGFGKRAKENRVLESSYNWSGMKMETRLARTVPP